MMFIWRGEGRERRELCSWGHGDARMLQILSYFHFALLSICVCVCVCVWVCESVFVSVCKYYFKASAHDPPIEKRVKLIDIRLTRDDSLYLVTWIKKNIFFMCSKIIAGSVILLRKVWNPSYYYYDINIVGVIFIHTMECFLLRWMKCFLGIFFW